jgi:hypothetical protein
MRIRAILRFRYYSPVEAAARSVRRDMAELVAG